MVLLAPNRRLFKHLRQHSSWTAILDAAGWSQTLTPQMVPDAGIPGRPILDSQLFGEAHWGEKEVAEEPPHGTADSAEPGAYL